MTEFIRVRNNGPLRGQVTLEGAKNAVLVTMASLILAPGLSRLYKVPKSQDVYFMITLLRELGAVVEFDEERGVLAVDTSSVVNWQVSADLMKKMRASVLVMGPLLARLGRAQVVLPGGCGIGARPIDFHLKAFERMGADIHCMGDAFEARSNGLKARRHILDYPSVGATENMLMAAVLTPGISEIVNAALEPEVFDLIDVLKKMGARIEYAMPATIVIRGVESLQPVEHTVMPDRLEAGTILAAVAMSGGEVSIPDAPADSMELFIEKLRDMGHEIHVGEHGVGIRLVATRTMRPISFKTMPYPGFPTDLQAPAMALASIAHGTSVIHETVFENRMLHVQQLQKMGANIVLEGAIARVNGVEKLYGADVEATDIRASAALVIAGLAAEGETRITNVRHLLRGYQGLDEKLRQLGAFIEIVQEN